MPSEVSLHHMGLQARQRHVRSTHTNIMQPNKAEVAGLTTSYSLLARHARRSYLASLICATDAPPQLDG